MKKFEAVEITLLSAIIALRETKHLLLLAETLKLPVLSQWLKPLLWLFLLGPSAPYTFLAEV